MLESGRGKGRASGLKIKEYDIKKILLCSIIFTVGILFITSTIIISLASDSDYQSDSFEDSLSDENDPYNDNPYTDDQFNPEPTDSQFNPEPTDNQFNPEPSYTDSCDLTIRKTSNPGEVSPGEQIAFEITVINNGPGTAKGVQVFDRAPEGTSFYSADPSSFDQYSGCWNVGDLEPYQSRTLRLVVTASASTQVTNSAEVRTTSQDSNPSDNFASAYTIVQEMVQETEQEAVPEAIPETIPEAVQETGVDLSVSLSANSDSVNVGDQITYSLSVNNNGPGTAGQVQVSFPVPQGTEFVSADQSYDQYSGSWFAGDLTPYQPASMQLTVRTTSSGGVSAGAQVQCSSNELNPGDNSASAYTTVQEAGVDLSVSLSANPELVNVGDQITYSLSVNNNGPGTASQVQVSFPVPQGTEFVSADQSYDQYSGSWFVGDLAPYQPANMQIIVKVISSEAVNANAQVQCSSNELNPGDNSAQAYTQVQDVTADLQLTKSAYPDTVNVGEQITYTITISNNGQSTAKEVSVTESIPEGTTFVSQDTPKGYYDSSSGIWSVGELAPVESAALTLTVTADMPGSKTNNAGASTTSSDVDPSNNAASITTEVRESNVDLMLTKTASSDSVNIGEQITYTVTVSNNGQGTAKDVSVTDSIPEGTTLVSSDTAKGYYDQSSGVWSVGELAQGESAALTLAVTADTPGTKTNNAEASTTSEDINSNNNIASATTEVQEFSVDLQLTKSASPESANIGEQITYSITVTNNGQGTAKDIQVTDRVPEGTTFVSFESVSGPYDQASGIWSVGELASYESTILTLIVTADVPGTVINMADVTTSSNDIDMSNNAASAPVIVKEATVDLALTKSSSPESANIGEQITYTVTITNKGQGTARDVSVTDNVPEGTTLVSSEPAKGTYDRAIGVWSIGEMAPEESTTLTLIITADTSGSKTNSAEASTTSEDVDTSNNIASATTEVQDASVDLLLTNLASSDSVNIGEQITYTVTISNNGQGTAKDVQITDKTPDGTTLVSADTAKGSYDQSSGVWSVGELAPGESAALTLTVTADTSGSKTNNAEASATSEDVDTSNNVASVTTEVREDTVDLQLAKVASADSVNVGEQITYTVTVSNSGQGTAKDVQVTDKAPDGTTLVSADTAKGSYDQSSGAWSVGELAPGESATLTLTVTADTSGSKINNAEATTSSNDVDSSNNVASASVTVKEATVDLALTKSSSSENANVGEQITYSITVTNNGQGTAKDVQVTDKVLEGTTLVSSDPAKGTYDQASGVWSVGELAHEESAVLTLIVTADTSGSKTNAAEATTSSNDIDLSNNAASATTTIQDASVDIVLTKSVSPESVNLSDQITFTLTVSNSGPGTAKEVSVTDKIPEGTTLVSPETAKGSFDQTSGIWSVGELAPEESAVLTLVVTADTIGSKINSAEATTSSNDVDLSNNAASATAEVREDTVDLLLTKTASSDSVKVGEQITYTVTVSNSGRGTAKDVSVTDQAPEGTTLVSSDPAKGTYDQASGIWSVGELAPEESSVLTIIVTADASGSKTNAAEATTSSNDVDPNNNAASATTAVQEESVDLVLTKSVSPESVNLSEQITFTITVSNSGPGTAKEVSVTDKIPEGTTLVSPETAKGSYDQATGIWSVGELAPEESAVLTLVVTADTPGHKLNNAEATTSSNDVDSSNNAASVTTEVQENTVDLLTKSAAPDSVNVGDEISYTVTVSNTGQGTAKDVAVTDTAPEGTTLVSPDASKGSYDPAASVWSIGELASEESATMTLTVTADTSGSKTNNAEATTSSNDIDPGNNAASATASVKEASVDLLLTKSTLADVVKVGEQINYTISVSNSGQGSAKDVQVTDSVPEGTTLVTSEASKGSYDETSGVWSVGDLASEESAALTLVVSANTPGEVVNTAEVSTSSNDTDTSNNRDSAATRIMEEGTDLHLTKQASQESICVGESITYTITVVNDGQIAAKDVRVTDKVPDGTTFISADVSAGSEYDSGSGTWEVGELAAGGSATLHLVVSAGSLANLTNTAEVVASTNDTNPENNAASAETSVLDCRASVSGTKYEDVNQDGTKGPDEKGLEGWTIELRKNGEFLNKTITDQNGQYSFTALDPGDYEVYEVMQDGWNAIAPANGAHLISLSSREDLTGIDFGNFKPSEENLIKASVSGTKFEDANQDGTRGQDENGLEGWSINLKQNGSAISTQVTDASGQYSFTDLQPGSYELEEISKPGWTPTAPPAGIHQIDLAPGQEMAGIDFGNFRQPDENETKSSLSGAKFEDSDGNGLWDQGEVGLEGWTIELKQGSTSIGTTTTGPGGEYKFSDLSAGDYEVSEVAQAGWIETHPANGTYRITVGSGEVVPGLDFGNMRGEAKKTSASISGQKYEDADKDGARDEGEKGLGGWTIELKQNGQLVNQTTTDLLGEYTFRNLLLGDYAVSEVLQEGWTQTAPVEKEHRVSLVEGQEEAEGLDFGNFKENETLMAASVSGMVFIDQEGDGEKDPKDQPVPGWNIKLEKGGTVIETTATDQSGLYAFRDLQAGSYMVKDEPQPGWNKSMPQNVEGYGIEVAPGDNITGKSFALLGATGTISGIKFYDIKSPNGIKDGGEPGLPNWQIELWDANLAAQMDLVTTKWDGTYTFSNVPPGDYEVKEVQQPGWIQTAPSPSPPGIYPRFTLVAGTDKTNVDFGNKGQATISGVKFNDIDGDGTRGNNEPGLPDWKIKLQQPLGVDLDQATTDSNGEYKFQNIGPGTYFVVEEVKSGWKQTHPVNPNKYFEVPVAAGNNVYSGNDFGNQQTGPQATGTVEGIKFYDLNGNGQRDQNEPGLQGWKIELVLNGAVIKTATTGTNGEYEFQSVNPGTYTVREVIPAGWTATTPAGGSKQIQVAASQTLTLDFGNRGSGSISGSKFDDQNSDKSWNKPKEPGLPDWTIELYYKGVQIATTTTGPNGAYSFSSLGPGAYEVREVVKAGWTQTSPPSGFHPVNLPPNSAVVARDFGNHKSAPAPSGSISGIKFDDKNANGVKNAGESGLSGWIIELATPAGVITTTTGGNGAYSFTKLAAGTYVVSEATRPGWLQTLPRSGAYIINLQPGGKRSGCDFGNFKPVPRPPKPKPKPKPIPKPVPVPLAALSGVKFLDINGNGVREPMEPGMPGWKIFLEQPPGKILFTGTTDPMGAYVFKNLPPGMYLVREQPVKGWAQTAPAKPGTYTVNLALPGQIARGLDFGNRGDLTISGMVYYDLNGNGLKDPSDPLMPGWVVQIGLPDKRWINTTTDQKGVYKFQDLPPGKYMVRGLVPLGWKQTVPPKPGSYNINLDVKDAKGLDFGNCGMLTISGALYHDFDGNGRRDQNEPGLPGGIIQLGMPDRRVVNATTDQKGEYKLANLPPGVYGLRTLVPRGWVLTAPVRPGTYTVRLDAKDAKSMDFGCRGMLSLSGTAFNDLNKNGIKESSEPGIRGLRINLEQPPGKVAANVMTDQTGGYSFKNLPPGEFLVKGTQMPGWTLAAPKTGSQKASLLDKDVRALDFACNGAISISGTVYQDQNGNGLKEGSEKGLNGWTVQLEQPQGRVVATNVTDKNGAYRFQNLPPGNYTLKEKVQPGWNQTAPKNRSHIINLTTQNVNGKDFGNCGLLSIAGAVYRDVNENATRDRGESGLQGWKVSLVQNGKAVKTSTTDRSGSYLISGLSPGNYAIEETLMPGWDQTAPAKTKAYAVNLTTRSVSSKDFGNKVNLSVSGVKFEDQNKNGIKDQNEPKLAGWSVQLESPAGEVIAEAATDRNGTYAFSGLSQGIYVLREVQQPGWNQSSPRSETHRINITMQSILGKDFGNYRT